MSSRVLPPTPEASAELAGEECITSPPPDTTFTLPPPACSQQSSQSSATCETRQQGKTSLRSSVLQTSPAQHVANSTGSSRKRTSSQAASISEQLSLPPPPSRSRKIIQMKPKATRAENMEKAPGDDVPTASANKSSGGSKGKKKQGGGSTSGRKIARKTAHSLIERRRRSKMNEEFGVLKDMIPACAGQEMHKLAILQASIEYMRYLEKCLAEVQGEQRGFTTEASATQAKLPPNSAGIEKFSRGERKELKGRSTLPDNPLEGDLESTAGSSLISPAISGVAPSPAFSVHHPQKYSYHQSAASLELPSPSAAQFSRDRAYAPHNAPGSLVSPSSYSNQASPMLLPRSSHSSAPSELDQEASAALLMLNASDRRTSVSNGSGEPPARQSRLRGISVKDLLRS